MKVVFDKDVLSLYINKVYFQNIDSSNKSILESYLRNLLIKLSVRYDLVFDGYYNVLVYVDENYGVIIDITKEELEYFDYFSNQVQFNIKVIESSFLYELIDYPVSLVDELDVYKISDKIYVKIKKPVDTFCLGKLVENSFIIYGNKVDDILKVAYKVR